MEKEFITVYKKDNITRYKFMMACKKGNIKQVKELLKYYNKVIIISNNNEEAFREACKNGHLEVAQWLLQVKPTINMSIKDECAFRWACYYEHLHVAQWLLKVKPTITISIYYENAFKYACSYGHLHVARWLQLQMPFKYIITTKEKVRPHNMAVTLAILTFLKTKKYEQQLTADLVCAIAKH